MADQVDVGEVSENAPRVKGVIDNSIKAAAPNPLNERYSRPVDALNVTNRIAEVAKKAQRGPTSQPAIVQSGETEVAKKERQLLDLLYTDDKMYKSTPSVLEKQRIQSRIQERVSKLGEMGWTFLDIKQEMNRLKGIENEALRVVGEFTPKPEQPRN